MSNLSNTSRIHELISTGARHGVFYPAPPNLSLWWGYGSIMLSLIVWQIVTGLILAMHYSPDATMAFDSIERITRDVPYGWWVRYAHTSGASLTFLALYIHMARGLYNRSFRKASLWNSGVILFLLVMVTAFLGYILPWGQMSYWGTTVITNLVTVIPAIGGSFVIWIWGGYSISNVTLKKLFVLHFLIPFLIIAKSALHVYLLHLVRSWEVNSIRAANVDSVMFYPKLVIKDIFLITVFVGGNLINLMFFSPDEVGHPDNLVRANPLVTPDHISPEWYFLPFYAILRSCPNKEWGVVLMFGSILALFMVPCVWKEWTLPFTYRSQKNNRITLGAKLSFWLFIFNFIGLGYLGGQVPEPHYVFLSGVGTAYYFLYLLAISPFFTFHDSLIATLERTDRWEDRSSYPMYFATKRFESRRRLYLIRFPYSNYGVYHWNRVGLF